MRTVETPLVLVVDEDEKSRELAKREFEAQGYEVKTTESFNEAVEVMESLPERFLIYVNKLDIQEKIRATLEDLLTGLDNFQVFRKRAEARLNPKDRMQPDVFSLLFIDVDEFGEFNRKHGHDQADEALIKIAAILRDHIRPSDIVCRRSGAADEFLVLLPGLNAAQARARGEMLRELVSNSPLEKPGAIIKFSISFGYSEVWRKDAADPKRDLAHLIDQAERGSTGLHARRKKERGY